MSVYLAGLTEKVGTKGLLYYVNHNNEVEVKQCTKCMEARRLSGFNKDKSKLGGRRSECRNCQLEARRKYYKENREDALEYQKNKYKEDPGRIARWREGNPDLSREINRRSARKWQRNNPNKVAMYMQKYIARKHELPNSLTEGQLSKINYTFSNSCALSGATDGKHLDHVIPISIGHGGTTYGNMIPLRADLNISKGARNIFDWFTDNRERFGLEQRRFDELIEYLAEINDMTTKEYEEYVRWCHDNPRTIDEIRAEEDDDGASA